MAQVSSYTIKKDRNSMLGLSAYDNGGPKSGNHGHAGRPGKRGGSASTSTSTKSEDKKTQTQDDGYSAAEAISKYQDFAYQDLNESLRDGKPLSEESSKVDKGLQKAFDKAKPLEADMNGLRRYTGTMVTTQLFQESGLSDFFKEKYGERFMKSFQEFQMDRENLDIIKEKLVGKIFEDKGYSSCTRDPSFFEKFSKGSSGGGYFLPSGVTDSMLITVPKGNKVLNLGRDGMIAGSGESEVILNKGGRFKITGVYPDTASETLVFMTEYLGSKSK